MSAPTTNEEHAISSAELPADPIADTRRAHWVWEVLRVAIGWTFLWSFLDKLLGLGRSTCGDSVDDAGVTIAGEFACDAAFVSGGSPTYGFLTFGTENSHTGDLFSWMASSDPFTQNVTDWLFMFGLGAIGISLFFGFLVRLGAVAGFLMFIFMYLAGFVWPSQNPFWDEHLLQAVVCIGLLFGDAGARLGVGSWWRRVGFVAPRPYLY